MEESLSFEEIVTILKNHIASILGLTLLFGVVTAFGTLYLLTPQYEATTQVLVSQSQDNDNYTQQDIQASLQLVNTYSDIITSPTILDEVIDNLELEYNTSTLSNLVDVSSENNSQVLSITVRDESPQMAEDIVNEISIVFQEEINDIMNVDNVSILATADNGDNSDPVSPQPILNIVLGLILGALSGIGLSFLREYLDNSVQNEEEVGKEIDLPVIGNISNFKR